MLGKYRDPRDIYYIALLNLYLASIFISLKQPKRKEEENDLDVDLLVFRHPSTLSARRSSLRPAANRI